MKKEWISFCSAHRDTLDNCDLYQFGYYEYSWKLKLENILFMISEKWYIKFINRRRK